MNRTNNHRWAGVFGATALLVASASTVSAQVVKFEALGRVDFNVFDSRTPHCPLIGVPALAPVSLRFSVDADPAHVIMPISYYPHNYPQPNPYPYPELLHVRGFPMIRSTFQFVIGGVNVPLDSHQVITTTLLPQLVIRNDDPGADGIYISRNVENDEIGVPLDLGSDFRDALGRSTAGFTMQDTLGSAAFPSMAIADCLHSYPMYSFGTLAEGCDGCLVWGWHIGGTFGNPLDVEFLSFRMWRQCGIADVASLGATPGDDGQLTVDDLVYYLSQFFSSNTAVADLVGLGGDPTPDTQVTVDDLVAFLSAFFAGCGQ